MSRINEMNSHRFADNYAIVKKSTDQCVGCEHNQQEAKAIATYLANYHGQEYVVVRNSKDDVRDAKAIRKEPFQVRNRDMILKDMGVWAS